MIGPTTVGELSTLLWARKNRSITLSPSSICLTPWGTDWVISIIWGTSSYSSNRFLKDVTPNDLLQAESAEICVWKTTDITPVQFEGWEHDYKGWCPVAEILRIVDYLSEAG